MHELTPEMIQAIKQEEIDFPRLFASAADRDFGVMYFMPENPDSYDGNHACLYPDKVTDLAAALREIAAFYHAMGRDATIYHPFEKDYFARHAEVLQACGFEYVPEEDHRVMLLTAENTIQTPKRLDIRLLDEWDERIATDILIPSGEPWEVEVTKKRSQQPGGLLFAGYLDGKAVVYTDIHLSPNGSTRFDYIVTAKEQRGNGYAGELLSFVTDYCREKALPLCWQWAGPSEHICYRAGFRQAFTMEGGYAVCRREKRKG